MLGRMRPAAAFHSFTQRIAALRPAAPCALCEIGIGAAGGPLCPGCERDFISPHAPRCAVCAIRLPATAGSELCGACLRHPPHFDATLALGDYAAPLDGVVLALKSGGRLALARDLGALLARHARGIAGPDALIAAVPLAFERHAERGFNQALEIARRVARDLSLPLDASALLRVRHAAPQHVLALPERRRNVRGAFAVLGDVRGKHLLVVDDVLTTGSTLDEVASVLKRAGAARVTNLVVARTP